jgi:hypothetical protein
LDNLADPKSDQSGDERSLIARNVQVTDVLGDRRMDNVKRLLIWDAKSAMIASAGAIIIVLITSSVPFAVVMWLVVYWGVINLKTRAGRDVGSSSADSAERVQLSMETSAQKLAGMRTLVAQIDRESTREIVQRICDQSDEVLQLMLDDRQKAAFAPLYLEQLLEPAEAMLETYVRLKTRGLLTTNELVARTESQDFPMIERASRLFRDQLRSEPIADRKSLEQTLSFNVESQTTIVEPRRNR